MSAAPELTAREKFRQRADAAARKLRQALIDASLDAELAGKPPIALPPMLVNDPGDGKPQGVVTARKPNGDFAGGGRRGNYTTASRLTMRAAVQALDAARKPGDPSTLEKITGALLTLAADGEPAAVRLLAERIDPPPPGRFFKVPIKAGMTVEEKMTVVDREVAEGRLTVQEGVLLAQLFMRAVEVAELRAIRGELDEMKRALSGRG